MEVDLLRNLGIYFFLSAQLKMSGARGDFFDLNDPRSATFALELTGHKVEMMMMMYHCEGSKSC